MITEERIANAIGGKTTRACDGCLRKRARWYCAADDAFLCQGCDSSVHSANQLASRHGRFRLEAASAKLNGTAKKKDGAATVWHQGFTKKARSPRPNKGMLVQQAKCEEKISKFNEPLVPEIGSEEGSVEENSGEQLLYQVPIFDPFDAERCCNMEGNEGTETAMVEEGQENIVFEQDGACDLDDLHGFLPSDIDIAEFAADVESLLASGLDKDSSEINGLGLLECKEENDNNANICSGENKVKVKDEEAFSIAREATDWNLDVYESSVIGEEELYEEKVVAAAMMNNNCKLEMRRNVSLRLNYEAVISAWASQGCPWTTGSRPQFNADDCWPDCTGSCGNDYHHPYGGVVRCHGRDGDGGREARVSRYREKRRTRLFSKKIRYEVRKLNAEKRPRMKGRFVKRTPFVGMAAAVAAASFPCLDK